MSLSQSSEIRHNEIVIVGAGLAGLFVAWKLSPTPVTIVTAAPLGKGASSSWAQGGIAAALDHGDTSFAHALDTMQAGAGIVNPDIAHILTSQAPSRIKDLLSFGTPFDRSTDGELLLSKEAAHSARRIVRVKGDRAGWAIMKALVAAVRERPNIQLIEGYTAKKIDMGDNGVQGIHTWSDKGEHLYLSAQNIVLAAGGTGALFKITTNPKQANGEALAMAARAGAVLADMEFVQFHPTAINTKKDPAPLATEALRGEGAVLINKAGERFMLDVHADAELAPRDIVARAVFRENVEKREAFLDCRDAIGAQFEHEFPSVYTKCREAGIDPVTQPIPVAPAAHFHMGGIHTDAFGRTTLNGLWACGEVASTGAHGANRLASNSLLEAVVFAARVAEDINASQVFPNGCRPKSIEAGNAQGAAPVGVETVLKKSHQKDIREMRELMDLYVGIERNEEGLILALSRFSQLLQKHKNHLTLSNMLTCARMITVAALLRKESRGGHYRTDFPKTSNKLANRSFLSLKQANKTSKKLLRKKHKQRKRCAS